MILKNIFVYPQYPENLKKLHELAYNLWCTWDYDAVNLFYRIDAQHFKVVNHNPVEFLLTLPKEKIVARHPAPKQGLQCSARVSIG